MDKPKPKVKKNKLCRQITYPAPYSSQPWVPDVQPVLMKNNVGRSTSLFRRSKRPTDPRSRAWSQQFTSERPDPTAPHLKYGVFRNRRGAAARPLQNVDTLKRLPMRSKLKLGQVNKDPKDLISQNSSITAAKKPLKKVLSEFTPKFVFRNTNINKSYSRELSFSKVNHLDIKPRIFASLPPSFCPSPNFKNMPQRYFSPRLSTLV